MARVISGTSGCPSAMLVLTIATATARLTSPLATVKRGVGDTYLESCGHTVHKEHRFTASCLTSLISGTLGFVSFGLS